MLINVAFGDHQVTNFQADVEARTIGAAAHRPALYTGRWPGVTMLWDVPTIDSYPVRRVGDRLRDIGPVREDPGQPGRDDRRATPAVDQHPESRGEDPHGAPRGAPQAVQLISDFLQADGAVTNVCGPAPCFAGGFTGP